MAKLSFVSYHYLSRDDEFKRIWGIDFNLFKEHIAYYLDNYKLIDPKELLNNNFTDDGNYLLLTFDDGLREHYQISEYLLKFKIKVLFSISTCILRNEPPNPQIIHFGMAYYGIRKFYQLVVAEIEKDFPQHLEFFPVDAKKIELMALHKIIKDVFRIKLNYFETRRILLQVYQKYLLKDFPDFMVRIFLGRKQIDQIIKSGHSLGVHTDTHCVVSDIIGNQEIVKQEIEKPKQILSQLVGEEVNIFTYPFGLSEDILDDQNVLKGFGYDLVFTAFNPGLDLNRLNLGRYPVNSQDRVDDLKNNLWQYSGKLS